MTDLADLAAALVTNFRTVRIPASERPEGQPTGWWAMAKGRREDSRAAYACRDRLRRLLVEHGHHRFLHHLEPDPVGGWRLHFLVADDAALPLLDELTEGMCGPGDPVSFDPEEFVLERIRHLSEDDAQS